MGSMTIPVRTRPPSSTIARDAVKPVQKHKKNLGARQQNVAELQEDYFNLTVQHVVSDNISLYAIVDPTKEWRSNFEALLLDFRSRDDRISFITSPLTHLQRQQVRTLTGLLQLSHMSIGRGDVKRLLLTKCELHAPETSDCRNPDRNYMLYGQIDPRIVTFRCNEWAGSPEALRHFLEDAGMVPSVIVRERFLDGRRRQFDMRACFDSPEDAAAAVKALEPGHSCSSARRSALEVAVQACEYTLFKTCDWEADGKVSNLAQICSLGPMRAK